MLTESVCNLYSLIPYITPPVSYCLVSVPCGRSETEDALLPEESDRFDTDSPAERQPERQPGRRLGSAQAQGDLTGGL